MATGTVIPGLGYWNNGVLYTNQDDAGNWLPDSDVRYGSLNDFLMQGPNAAAIKSVGLPVYNGDSVKMGLRGAADNQYGMDLGGENARWVVNPATGKEEIGIAGPGGTYLLSDILKKYGSIENAAAQTSGPANNGGNDTGNGSNSLFDFTTWGQRGSNDTFSGKDGLRDLGTIASMIAATLTGGALSGGLGAADAGATAAGTAGFEGGAAGAGLGGAAAGFGGATAPTLLADAGTTMTDVSPGLVDTGIATAAGGNGLVDLGGGLTVDQFGNVVGGSTLAGGAATGATGIGGGMGVDAYGNVTGASGAAGAAGGIGGILSNPSVIGAGLGAVLGGQAASAKPAGTTTTTQDVPAWLMPYVTGNLNAAQSVRNQLAAGPNATSAALPEELKTINGDYLNPATNPYLDATYQHAAGLVGANVDSRFEAAGRYGSGAHQGVLQEGLNNLATNIYGGNYQAERARQAAAVTGAPAFDTGTSQAAFAPFSGFNSLIPGQSRSTTSPFFSNTAGGILSGALAGSQIARMFG